MRVRADSPSWLKTLRDLRGTLILRLQAACGPLAPRGLAFVQGPVGPRSARRRPSPPLKPVPLSDISPDIAASADKVPTEEGRDAYLRAAAAFQARFRSVPRS